MAIEAFIAAIFTGYGIYGITTGNLVIPYMRSDADHELRQLHSLHFQGGQAWLVRRHDAGRGRLRADDP